MIKNKSNEMIKFSFLSFSSLFNFKHLWTIHFINIIGGLLFPC